MYKVTHKNLQRRSDALTIKNMANGSEDLTPIQQREALVCAKKRIVEQIMALPSGSKERKILGRKQHQLENQIHEIRPKCKPLRSVESYFIEVAKERLTRFEYQLIMTEASTRARENADRENHA